jgi:hypothetical protein
MACVPYAQAVAVSVKASSIRIPPSRCQPSGTRESRDGCDVSYAVCSQRDGTEVSARGGRRTRSKRADGTRAWYPEGRCRQRCVVLRRTPLARSGGHRGERSGGRSRRRGRRIRPRARDPLLTPRSEAVMPGHRDRVREADHAGERGPRHEDHDHRPRVRREPSRRDKHAVTISGRRRPWQVVLPAAFMRAPCPPRDTPASLLVRQRSRRCGASRLFPETA